MTSTPPAPRTAADVLVLVGAVVFGVGMLALIAVLVGWGLDLDLPGLFVATPWLLIPPGFALGLLGLVLQAVHRRRR